jgi:hypothetical protein
MIGSDDRTDAIDGFLDFWHKRAISFRFRQALLLLSRYTVPVRETLILPARKSNKQPNAAVTPIPKSLSRRVKMPIRGSG